MSGPYRLLAHQLLSGAEKDAVIDPQVDDQYEGAQDNLLIPGEVSRIDQREEIMIDEAVCVARLPAFDPEHIFQRCERTHSVCELNPYSPQGGRQMCPDDPSPPECQKPSQHREQGKGEMHDNHSVRQDTMEHPCSHFACRSANQSCQS